MRSTPGPSRFPLRSVPAVAAALVLALAACSVTTDDMANMTVDAAVMADATPPDGQTPVAPSPGREADGGSSTDQGGPADNAGTAGSTPGTAQGGGEPTAPPTTGGADRSDFVPPSVDPPPGIGSAGAGDRYYPTYGNGGYDVISYDLDLDWDDRAGLLDGTATITMTATEDLEQFDLDLVGFEVSGIEIDGAQAAFTRDGAELIIRPAAPLTAGTAVAVSIDYHGAPSLVPSVGAPFSTGWNDFGDTIVVAGEPEGPAGWYPVNDHPSDKATYRISITTDSDLFVGANGTQVSVTQNGDRTTWVYESASPQASYLTTVVIGDFVTYEAEPSASGVPIRHFFHRSLYDASVATMARTGDMIDAFESLFGPYPFENYGTIVVDADLGFALETQTLSVFGGDLVDSSGANEDIVAHELAHQWFGDSISLDQWSDIWLNEGFASYAEYLWFEASQPGYDIDAAVLDDYENYAFLLDSPPGAPPADDLFNASVYLRGGFTLHALRTTIGDDAFFRLLRTYVEEYGGGNAVTGDFTSLAEQISGQDLEAFFDAWLFETGIPELPR